MNCSVRCSPGNIARGHGNAFSERAVVRFNRPRHYHTLVHAEEKETAKQSPKTSIPDTPDLVSEPIAEAVSEVATANEEAISVDEAVEAVEEGTEIVAKKRSVLSHRLDEALGTEELLEEFKDKEEFGKRGEIILVVQLVACLLTLFPPMQMKGLVYLLGAVGMVIGSVLCAWSVICLGRSFSPLVTPRKNHKLVTTGMYEYMRHPLYAGVIMLAFGLAAVSYSESRILLAFLLYAILNYKAKQEEKAMTERYGDEYAAYMDKTNRFLPVL